MNDYLKAVWSQLNFLVEISKIDSEILLNIFDFVFSSKIPIQLPLTESEIKAIVKNPAKQKEFQKFSFNGKKQTNVTMVGSYIIYDNCFVYIGSSDNMAERFDYHKTHTSKIYSKNASLKKLHSNSAKNKPTLSFIPLFFFSTCFSTNKNLKEALLTSQVNALEYFLTQAVKNEKKNITILNELTKPMNSKRIGNLVFTKQAGDEKKIYNLKKKLLKNCKEKYDINERPPWSQISNSNSINLLYCTRYVFFVLKNWYESDIKFFNSLNLLLT